MTNLPRLLNIAVCAMCAIVWTANGEVSANDTKSSPSKPSAPVKATNLKRINETIGGLPFSIALPADFKVISRKKSTLKTSKKNLETVVFGAPSPDGEPSDRIVIAVTDGFKDVSYDLIGPTQFADATLKKYPEMFTDYHQSASATAELGGKKFGTASFEGRKAVFGPRLFHAFLYVGLMGDYTMAIEAYDLSPKGSKLDALRKVAQSIKFE